MPLPFFVWAAIAAVGTYGAGKTIGAVIDNNEANDVNEQANEIIEEAKTRINSCRDITGEALKTLGAKKAYVLNNEIKRFVKLYKQLHNLEQKDSPDFDESSNIIDSQELENLREMSDFASSILGGTAAGTLAGALTAFGAYSGVMALGAASTGTAIATLSGAAATNATLAFLGGGSLAVGGLGIAGGMAVLGGLVAAPALAVLGFFMGANASENLDKAHSNYYEACKFRSEMETAAVMCNGIRRRAYMFERLLMRLEVLMNEANNGLTQAINTYGTDYKNFSQDAKKCTASASSLAKAVKTILDTPILTEDGKLTEQSLDAANSVKMALSA